MASIINAATSGGLISTADTSGILQLQTAGTTAVTVDASQNVGIGVTPSATNTSYKAQEIGFVGNGLIGFGANDFAMSSGAYYSSSGWKHSATNSLGASFYEQYNGQHLWYNKTAVSHSAGDAISFTQAMTLDASGNLFLGVTSSAAGRLAIKDVAGSGNNIWLVGRSSDGTSSVSFRNNADTAYNARIECFDTGVMTFGTGTSATERMRLDSSGNLGLGGTASAVGAYRVLDLNHTTGGYLSLSAGGTRVGALYGSSSAVGLEAIGASSPIQFLTNGAERARIDSSGRLFVGVTTTTFSSSERLEVNGSVGFVTGTGNTNLFCANSGTGSQTYVAFYVGTTGTNTGNITTNGTTTTYATTSDYRLKDNVIPMTGALAKVAQLKPVNYKWKADGSDGQGFIAHELQAVVPDCVTGEKDAINEDGKPRYQSVDTSFLVATLTAAIQEQQALIQSLKARLDAANL